MVQPLLMIYMPVNNNPNKKVVDKFYYSKEWRILKNLILEIKRYTCSNCGFRGFPGSGTLHVDHIKSRKQYPELALNALNLRVLCIKCHSAAGTSLGRGGDSSISRQVNAGTDINGIPLGKQWDDWRG